MDIPLRGLAAYKSTRSKPGETESRAGTRQREEQDAAENLKFTETPQPRLKPAGLPPRQTALRLLTTEAIEFAGKQPLSSRVVLLLTKTTSTLDH